MKTFTKQEMIEEAHKLVEHYGLEDCKKCYGKGYIGYDINQKKLVLCKCLENEIMNDKKNAK